MSPDWIGGASILTKPSRESWPLPSPNPQIGLSSQLFAADVDPECLCAILVTR